MSPSRWPRSPFQDICSSTSFGSSRNCGRRRSRQQRNELSLSRVPRKTTGDLRLDERKIDIPRRANASRPAPERSTSCGGVSTIFQSSQSLAMGPVSAAIGPSIWRMRVKVSRDLASDRVGAAARLERADVAIQFAGAIESCALGCDAASGDGVGASELDQLFARGAGVTVALRIESEVGAGKRAVRSVGLVEDRDVRGNIFLFDQPCQAVRRAIGAVCGQGDGLYAKAGLG